MVKPAEKSLSETSKPDIRLIPAEEIEKFFAERNKPRFHARQVTEWLWKKHCRSFAEMTNIPQGIREDLQNHFSFPVIHPEVIKVGFRLSDSNLTEGVLIPSGSRSTACISSQSGCPLACTFCATGRLGYFRNLTAGEIFDQVVYLTRLAQPETRNQILSNLVFMGMGEPLLNYDQVKLAIEKITSPDGLGMSPQRITVSTVGIPEMIRKMADDKPRYHFALSLHTANNAKRNQIVPVNRKYPLESLSEAMKYYHRITQKRFTIEFILFRDFNDSLADAKELAQFCKSFPVKINLIEYNPVPGSDFRKPEPMKVTAFKEFLESKNMVVNIRGSRGADIDAACGQLAAKFFNVLNDPNDK
jgi:23S rRNA (adenine2503-C2)-methyltransferase